MSKTKYIEREGKTYRVVKEVDTDYCVACDFEFCTEDDGTEIRTLYLWLAKRYCTPVNLPDNKKVV